MNFKPGEQAKALPERNDALIKDYLKQKADGRYWYSITQLVGKYKIGHARIFQLLKKNGIKRK